MSKPTVHIAIGLLLHGTKVLVGWRDASQHQGLKHEFAGGKVEKNETPQQACRREIFEEVGVDIEQWFNFDLIEHEYEDITVRLHVFFAYIPHALLDLVQPPWAWYERDHLASLNFPKANIAIIERLMWSRYIKINSQLSAFAMQPNLDFYWRIQPEQLDIQTLQNCSADVLEHLILNVEIYHQLPETLKSKIRTLHLKQHQLMSFQNKDLELGKRYIAACHTLDALQYAEKIGCEAAFISPVNSTKTHLNAQPLGWETVADWTSKTNILLFALGGMQPENLDQARACGLYGVAGISNF